MLNRLCKLPIYTVSSKWNDNILLLLILLLTSLNGIAIDLYTPSLPAIAIALHVPPAVAKATISMGLIGFAFGVFTLGAMSDRLGRRPMILAGLLVFVLASVVAVYARNIQVFMCARFFQGMGVASAAMLSRAMLLDHFSGKALYSAMLYTTIAWGLGPVVAPFIGGYIQVSFGWQMNFVIYAAAGFIALLMVTILLPETLLQEAQRQQAPYTQRLASVLSHPTFIFYAIITTFCFTQYILYNVVGAFLIEHQLGYSAITFGHTALLVGLGYLFGTIASRLLQNRISTHQTMYTGIFVICLADMLFFCMAYCTTLSLWGLVLPAMLMVFGTGIIIPNAIAKSLEPFKKQAGTAASMSGGVVMLLGFVLTAAISHIQIHSLAPIAWVVLALIIGQFLLIQLARSGFSGAKKQSIWNIG